MAQLKRQLKHVLLCHAVMDIAVCRLKILQQVFPKTHVDPGIVKRTAENGIFPSDSFVVPEFLRSISSSGSLG